jgi:hypothetical protein
MEAGRMSTTVESSSEELHIDVEYREAMSHHRADSQLRRQGLAFASSFQILAIAALSEKVALSDPQVLMLSLLTFVVCFVGFNQDLRLSGYLLAYEKRILEIEGSKSGVMHILKGEFENKRKFPFSNTSVFSGFYLALLVAWGWMIWRKISGWEELVPELFGST